MCRPSFTDDVGLLDVVDAAAQLNAQHRQPIAVIPLADIDDQTQAQAPLNPPVSIPPRQGEDAISKAFAATRETIALLEAERDVENYAPGWSCAQHCRRVA